MLIIFLLNNTFYPDILTSKLYKVTKSAITHKFHNGILLLTQAYHMSIIIIMISVTMK